MILLTTNGHEFVIGNRDCDLAAYSWHKQDGGYIICSSGRLVHKKVHRVIAERMGLDMSKDIDHRDGKPGNNRRSNLRAATKSQNQANSRRPSNNTSGYKGVSWDRNAGKWRAYIRVGRQIHLGLFQCPEEAHRAYLKAAKHYFGQFYRG